MAGDGDDMCGGQLEEPPIAELTAMALWNASLVKIWDGMRSSMHHLDDAVAGGVGDLAALAIGGGDRWRSRAGTCPAPRPGSSSRSAVPMVLQWPTGWARRPQTMVHEARHSRCRRRRAFCRAAFQTTVPEPARVPSQWPSSIGPPDRTMAGMSAVAAAMRQAGVVLSQPVVRTTPSDGSSRAGPRRGPR